MQRTALHNFTVRDHNGGNLMSLRNFHVNGSVTDMSCFLDRRSSLKILLRAFGKLLKISKKRVDI